MKTLLAIVGGIAVALIITLAVLSVAINNGWNPFM